VSLKRKIAAGVASSIVVAFFAVVAGWAWLVFIDRSRPATTTQVVIRKGSTFAQIAASLADARVIDNALAFRVLARLRREDADVRSGGYRFQPHQTASEVLHALVTGGAQTAVWLTVPEGFTAREIAERLEREGLGRASLFEHAFLTTPLDVDGTRVPNLEGFLFPNTYLVPIGATPQEIESQLTGEFFKELPPDAAAQARALHVTVPQLIAVASLVEREAKVDADRPLIAGVIYNRLRRGMPLQVDAAIEYALPHHKSELSNKDLAIDSPYNTYRHTGLPPTPIANPGLASIDAALRPAKTNALYYVYCGNGRHAFAQTYREQQANIARCLDHR
jgi:UPF0755 protein